MKEAERPIALNGGEEDVYSDISYEISNIKYFSWKIMSNLI